jgi:hypothetical protein
MHLRERTIGARVGIEGRTATSSLSIRSEFVRTTGAYTCARRPRNAKGGPQNILNTFPCSLIALADIQ